MAMKSRNLAYHLKESILNLARNGWMTIASVGAVTVTLLMLGVFIVFGANTSYFTNQIEQSAEIRVHVDVTATPENEAVLQSELEKIPEIDSVDFSSKDEELEMHKESLGLDQSEELYQQYKASNPLHDVFVVKLKDPQQTETVVPQIEKLDYVDDINYGEDYVGKMFEFTKWVQIIGSVLIIALALVAVFLIVNTIRVTILSRKREIEIMRLVGATNAFIRWPFFLEGIWLGLLGSIIPITTISITYIYVDRHEVLNRMGLGLFKTIPPDPFILYVALSIVVIGTVIGVIASLLSIRKHIKI